MNKLKLWPVATVTTVFLTVMGAMSPVLAQQPSTAPRSASLAPPPPELQDLEEGEKPAITLEKKEQIQEDSITQQRQQGVVTDIKVNSGGSTYHIIPRTAGTSLPGDSSSSPANGAQWVIKEFDWGQKKERPSNTGEAQKNDSKTAPIPPDTPAQ